METLRHTTEVIRHNRFIKDFAHELRIPGGGNPGKDLEAIYSDSDIVENIMQDQYNDWIKGKQSQFSDYLSDIPEAEVEDTYRKGLDLFIKKKFRLLKAVSPEEVDKLHDPRYLQDAIFAYTYDFAGLLKLSQRLEIQSSVGLEIAKMAYHHDSTSASKLYREYDDLGQGIVTWALTKHPASSPEYLAQVRSHIPQLKEVFPEFTDTIIIRAAQHFQDPFEHLNKVRAIVPELTQEFTDFEEGAIVMVAAEKKNPREFLLKTRNAIARLRNKYPHITPWVINSAALTWHQDPDTVIERYQDRVVQLKEQYPTVDQWLLSLAAFRHDDPAEFIERTQEMIQRLNEKYPDIGEGRLGLIVAGNKDPEKIIERFYEQLPILKEEFPDLEEGTIRVALLNRPARARDYLVQVRSNFKLLQDMFSNIDPWILKTAAETVNNPESVVQRLLSSVDELKGKFHFSEAFITRVAIQHPDNPSEKLQEILEKVAQLQRQYPSVERRHVVQAVVSYGGNPENYIRSKSYLEVVSQDKSRLENWQRAKKIISALFNVDHQTHDFTHQSPRHAVRVVLKDTIESTQNKNTRKSRRRRYIEDTKKISQTISFVLQSVTNTSYEELPVEVVDFLKWLRGYQNIYRPLSTKELLHVAIEVLGRKSTSLEETYFTASRKAKSK